MGPGETRPRATRVPQSCHPGVHELRYLSNRYPLGRCDLHCEVSAPLALRQQMLSLLSCEQIPAFRGIPKCFVGHVFFRRLVGVPRQKKPYNLQNIVVCWPCRRRWQGQKTRFSVICVVFWHWHPRPPRNHVAKQTLRDPSDSLPRCRATSVNKARDTAETRP